MLPALLLFLSYFLLLTAIRSGIEKGSVPQYIGLWPVHFLVLILGFSLLFKGRKSGRVLKAKIAKNKEAI